MTDNTIKSDKDDETTINLISRIQHNKSKILRKADDTMDNAPIIFNYSTLDSVKITGQNLTVFVHNEINPEMMLKHLIAATPLTTRQLLDQAANIEDVS